MSLEAWGDEGESDAFEAARDAGWIDPTDQTKALIDVMNERFRQWDEEGWTPEHDDTHVDGQMATAAACYAMTGHPYSPEAIGEFWPWSRKWWKPKDRRQNLVRAGALILAEIERLDRAKQQETVDDK